MGWYQRFSFQPYVSVGAKLSQAEKKAQAVAKKQGRNPAPVRPEGRKVSKTFWGQAWCDHLDHMSDFSNRLGRGLTYLRNGSVVDLLIKPGRVESIVAGSEPYTVEIDMERLKKKSWEQLKGQCSKSIRSLVDLLAGKLDEPVIRELTHPETGMFPKSKEMRMKCSCPDYAQVCKHIAAVFYAVGCRLDSQPELLFVLRDVDHKELIGLGALAPAMDQALQGTDSLGGVDLGAMFGIEIEPATDSREKKVAKKKAPRKPDIAVTQGKSQPVEKPKPLEKTAPGKTKPLGEKRKIAVAIGKATTKKPGILAKSSSKRSKEKTRKLVKAPTTPELLKGPRGGVRESERLTKAKLAHLNKLLKQSLKENPSVANKAGEFIGSKRSKIYKLR